MTWLRSGKPDAGMTLNGVLGGLVGITAGCANLAPGFAILTGAVAGMLVVYATLGLERYVDDPVVRSPCTGSAARGARSRPGSSTRRVQLRDGRRAAHRDRGGVPWVFPLASASSPARPHGGAARRRPAGSVGLDLHEHAAQAYPEFVLETSGDGFGGVPDDEFIPAEL